MDSSLDVLLANKYFLLESYSLSEFMMGVMVLSIVDVVLKGVALWRAARMKKPGWFVVLLAVNSVGILPLIFILLTNKKFQEIKQS